MKIIKPIAVTPAKLTSTNIAETDEAEYSSATSYSTGQRVMVTGTGGGAATATHKIYESLIGSNLGNDPTNQTANSDKWLEISATNRWKMFDGKLSDPSSNAASIAITVAPGEVINAIAVFNVFADSIRIQVDDPTDGIVYDVTTELRDNSEVVDWYAYFFNLPITVPEFVTFDLPAYGSADINITLAVASGNASVGEIAIGKFASLGAARYGGKIGIVDYSRKDRDTFGNAVILEREYSQRVDFDLHLHTEAVCGIQRQLAEVRATPVVWAGTDDGGYGLLVYGYFRDFDIVLGNPVYSDCSIQVEGLT